MKLDKILIATGNKGKLYEFQKYFADYDIECVSLDNYQVVEPEENGNSFLENAQIKAKYYCQATSLPALADDSGLCVDQLDGMPGIYSARWAGQKKDFSIAIDKIYHELLARQVDLNQVTGYFYCALSLIYPSGEIVNFSGKTQGRIIFPARGENGFGYDPIFIPNGYDKTFAELDFGVKQSLSHRGKALLELQNYAQSYF